MLVLLVIVPPHGGLCDHRADSHQSGETGTSGDRLDKSRVVTTPEEESFVAGCLVAEAQRGTALLACPRESLVPVLANDVPLLERFVSVVDRIRELGFYRVGLEVIRA